jgi:CMP-N-acetylneuraminic acid synthetase
MKATAFIFARGGSKGLPGKNIRPLAGKPLIAWSIEHALSVKRIERVIVSTDSEEIASVAKAHGAFVPFMRPTELAADNTPEWLAWRHALNFLRDTEGQLPNVMVSVPATAPLRQPIDIENCLDEYARGDADVVITVTESHRSPYFNMVKENADGSVGLVIPPTATIVRRQDVPVVYDMATVAYVIRPEFVFSSDAIFKGRVRAVQVPKERAIDIDTLLDFQISEHLLTHRKYEPIPVPQSKF